MTSYSSVVTNLLPHCAKISAITLCLLLLQACSSSDPVSSPAEDEPVNSDTGGGGSATGANEPVNEPSDEPTGGDTGAQEPIDNPVDRVLPTLPDPPLTPAPGADSEPVRATGPVSTVTEFFLLRDPTRALEDNFGTLTDVDFAAGPLPAIVQTPSDVDPATNAPPFFDNLNDVEVFAGQELRVLFKPLDPDGGIPGLFPNAIPAGARYVDNFNGTRSLIWRPLQPDVGIREFTITATDPEAPFYRTERTIRIKVKMPSDPASIVNLPPAINLIRPHTVRVNDPVVLHIKVTDPNGTIPTLEIVNLPAGATLVPHYSEPDISIVRFVPDSAQIITLQLLARDADDPEKIGTKTITIEVLDDSDFIRPGASLKELASTRDLLIGYASLLNFYYRPDGALYADIAADEFNFVTTENSLKWDFVNPLPGKYRWAGADNVVNFAKARRLSVHGHTLIWHRQLPGWIKRSAIDERETHMREYIDRVLKRYSDAIPVWDVVNEAIDADGNFRNSTWFEAMGESFIDTAFRQARLSAPQATLLYNDYDIGFAGPKSEAMINLMQSLNDSGTPVDGVGFQLHLFADFDRFDEVAATFQKVAELDLDIYITELDVSIQSGQTDLQQAAVFEQILSLCLEQPRCKAFQTWGFTDMYSWRREFKPLLLDERYQPKPAYLALQKRLSEN